MVDSKEYLAGLAFFTKAKIGLNEENVPKLIALAEEIDRPSAPVNHILGLLQAAQYAGYPPELMASLPASIDAVLQRAQAYDNGRPSPGGGLVPMC